MKKYFLWFLIFTSSILFLTAGGKNKSYSIDSVDIIAKVNSDGSMDITENRTYHFRGSFKYAFREMPLRGQAVFSDFKISERGENFVLSDSKEPGTYQIYDKNDFTVIKWYYKARNEDKTFTFNYKVDGAITRYLDAAVLYYQFISSDWGKKQHNINVKIIPPEFGNYGSIRHWLHGPLWGESKIDFDGNITAWTEYIPAHRFFEIRALYPQDLFPQITQKNDFIEGNILKEEAAWVEESNRLREEALIKKAQKEKREKIGKKILPILAIIICSLSIYLFTIYGKRKRNPERIDILGEIPADISPALVSYLLNARQIVGVAIVGTIFDLAVRKFITLQEEQTSKRRGKFKSSYSLKLCRDFMEQNNDELEDFESNLIAFLFTDISGGNDVLNIKDLSKNRSKFIRFFNKWKKEVSAVAKDFNWFDLDSIKGGNITAAVGLVAIILFVISIFTFGISSLYILGATIFTFICAVIIPHHTADGRWQYDQWKAYKRFITKKKYLGVRKEEILDSINEMFVYGIIFGFTNRIFKDLADFLPASSHSKYVYWYFINGSESRSFTPDSFTKAFTTMVATANATISSATGSGGGGSVGGGGGASSGGGGAG